MRAGVDLYFSAGMNEGFFCHIFPAIRTSAGDNSLLGAGGRVKVW